MSTGTKKVLYRAEIIREIKEEKIIEVEIPNDCHPESLIEGELSDALESILDPDPEGELSLSVSTLEVVEEALLPDKEVSMAQIEGTGQISFEDYVDYESEAEDIEEEIAIYNKKPSYAQDEGREEEEDEDLVIYNR